MEEGESFEEAVVREVKEVTNLTVKAGRHLFSCDYSMGESRVYSADISGSDILQLGSDPECAVDDQMLQEVKGWPLQAMKDDFKLSRVIREMHLIHI